MKRSINVIAAILLLGIVPSVAQKRSLAPKKSVAKVVLTGKTDYTYYGLSDKYKTEYKVTGPGILYLNYRVRLPKDDFKSKDFQVRYTRSDNYLSTQQIPELLAGNLAFKSKSLTGNPSRAHQEVIIVPPGTYTYKFYKHKTNQKVHMRAFYEQHEKPQWRDFQPEKTLSTNGVRFIKSGIEKDYFRITKNSGFYFSIDDTSRIRVIVRPEFTYRMLAETVLKVSVSNLTTGETSIYKVNSSKSSMVEFVNDKSKIPGTSSTLYLDLDRPTNGTDLYSIHIAGGAKAAVLRVSDDTSFSQIIP